MPLKVYCPSCSEPNEYTLSKPSFCGQCGSKFESVASSPKPSVVKNTPIVKEQVVAEKEINIDKLEVDINVFDTNKGIKIEDLVVQQKTGFSRPKEKITNKKKAMELFQLEAGAGGRKAIEIQDNGGE